MPSLSDAIAAVRGANSVVVLTGAGVSAESGIPTFRDALTGLWARHDPEQLATERGFRADPALIWSWYRERRMRVARAEPNAAHRALVALARQRPTRIVTQNVDGLHARAGSEGVIELHGSIERASCLARCGWSGPSAALEALDARVPPHCPACGGLARPDVVWFGEMLPDAAWDAAGQACAAASLCLVIGTSAQVYPAAGLALEALGQGARLIVVNTEATPLDARAWCALRGKAGEVVPRLVDGAGRPPAA